MHRVNGDHYDICHASWCVYNKNIVVFTKAMITKVDMTKTRDVKNKFWRIVALLLSERLPKMFDEHDSWTWSPEFLRWVDKLQRRLCSMPFHANDCRIFLHLHVHVTMTARVRSKEHWVQQAGLLTWRWRSWWWSSPWSDSDSGYGIPCPGWSPACGGVAPRRYWSIPRRHPAFRFAHWHKPSFAMILLVLTIFMRWNAEHSVHRK